MLEENVMFSQQNELGEPTEQSKSIETNEPTKRTTQRQRKESMSEYRQLFLTPPKIVDRQTIFISRDLRDRIDRIDRIVRQIGDRKLSVSGFAQNVLQHHLEMYGDDIERWRKM
ncbi:MAG: DUF3408 domain-containing protein [Rikenellaceae bacterium]